MRVSVRVKPGASKPRVGGAYEGEVLIVAVNAPPVDGRANEAVIEAVAAAFGVRSRDVSLHSGHTARTKVLELDGDEDELASRLAELLAEH